MVGIAPPPPDALYRQIYPALEGHFLGEIEQPVATSDLMPSINWLKRNFTGRGPSRRALSIS
jgi:hypothetical protein